MNSSKPRAIRAGRPIVAAFLLATVSTACGGRQDTLRVAERFPLAVEDATSLEPDAGAGFRVAGKGRIDLVSDSGATVRSFSLPILTDAEIIGLSPGRLLVGTADGYILVSGDTTSTAVRNDSGTALLTADGTWVLAAVGQGDLVAYDGSTGQPGWGWPSVGAIVTALASSPEGDRIYHAVETADGEGSLFIRDMQTGRILGNVALGKPLRCLEVSPEGYLYGVAWREGSAETEVVALHWTAGELTEWWTAPIRRAEEEEVRIEISPADGSVGILIPGSETGLTILNGETGEVLHRFGGQASDLAFDEGGRIFLLAGGELLRLVSR